MNTEPKREWPKGMMFRRPEPNTPPFVKGRVSIQAKQLFEWVKANPDFLSEKGYLNFDLLESRDGNTIYFQVNTYKKAEPELPPQEAKEIRDYREAHNSKSETDIKPSGIPF